MLLKIIHDIAAASAYTDIDKTFCVTKSYDGKISLQFDMPIKHPLYSYIEEETELVYENQKYKVKGINERSRPGICTINAELDLRTLQNKLYISKTWTDVSLADFMSDILYFTGWRCDNAKLINKKTTIVAEGNTPLDLLEKCTDITAFGVCCEFDTRQNLITCIQPEKSLTTAKCYFVEDLNLSELTMKGSSSQVVTRLYPIGKDGLTIESVNNGLPYIEDHRFTDFDICKIWRDERYTNAQSLKDDAIAKLATMAAPIRSYTCKIIDLAKTIPETYGDVLNFKLYDKVIIIDRIRRRRIAQQIVEIKEYPADHSLDTVILSSVPARITRVKRN